MGPVLYVIYYNDITKHINEQNITLYADDTTILTSGRHIHHRYAKLQRMTKKLTDFLDDWGLKANEAKTELVDFTWRTRTPKRTQPYAIKMNDRQITQRNKAKYLGLYLDKNLNYRQSITYTRNKATAAFKSLTPLFRSKSITTRVKTVLYKVFILPILMYGVEIYKNGTDGTTDRLVSKYNRHLRQIYTWNHEPTGTKYTRETNATVRKILNMDDLEDKIQLRWHKHRQRTITHNNPLLRDTIQD